MVRSDVVTHPRFGVARFDPANWSVALGCPQAPTLLLSGERHPKAGGVATLAGRTTTPSGYRAFVFVVPQAEIDRMFGGLSFQFATQELMCEDGLCSPVSTAYYVSAESLFATNQSVAGRISKGLVQAVGLEPPNEGSQKSDK